MITAIVPMRHRSQRIPGKNYKELGGKPLFFWILETILNVDSVSQILVDTDSAIIATLVAENFPSVTILNRPAHLSAADLSMNLVLENSIKFAKNEYVVQTHTTNPFLSAKTLESACEQYLQSDKSMTLMSVSKIQGRLWTSRHLPINHDPKVLQQTQDLDSTYLESSSFYIFSKTSFGKNMSRLTPSFQHFELDGIESWDIDEIWQWKIAEAIMSLS